MMMGNGSGNCSNKIGGVQVLAIARTARRCQRHCAPGGFFTTRIPRKPMIHIMIQTLLLPLPPTPPHPPHPKPPRPQP
ncbi:hypothetical protein BV22DRAFT_941272 [Leucogyrophana mollusca]|uniref:Uncharacterized protein n=1 Tax=Leucogyrophana mollusca TaxID=85980 RepID=A0ACB8AUJ2_9AGAM|nr:hypothetical protein BV22DRAFT_941272 [Leucogyrophana mollusca]